MAPSEAHQTGVYRVEYIGALSSFIPLVSTGVTSKGEYGQEEIKQRWLAADKLACPMDRLLLILDK
jgi:hypothetical protein